MVLGVPSERAVTGHAAARAREANWERVRRLADRLGDTWDLETATFELSCECGRPTCESSVPVALAAYVQARTNGHDVVLSYHEDPLDLVVHAAEAYRVVARSRGAVDAAAVGDWTCDCGQLYRVAARGTRVVLWPRNSATGFRREPIESTCVNGCPIDALAVLQAVVAPARAA